MVHMLDDAVSMQYRRNIITLPLVTIIAAKIFSIAQPYTVVSKATKFQLEKYSLLKFFVDYPRR